MFKTFLQVTRILFLPASIIPFFTGTVLAYRSGGAISSGKVLLGTLGVAAAHVSGNILNDYFDHKYGADTSGNKRSVFFGGSGSIQSGIITAGTAFISGIAAMLEAFICGAILFVITKDPALIYIMAAAAFLTYGYTGPPMRLAYRGFGELDIFLLFGVLMVMASYYLFTGSMGFEAVLAALPVSFLITAVIICNEIPDHDTDIKAGKFNLISLFGRDNAYIVYGVFIILSFITIIINIALGYLHNTACLMGILFLPGIRVMKILKYKNSTFEDLVRASGLTGAVHFVVGLGVIICILIR